MNSPNKRSLTLSLRMWGWRELSPSQRLLKRKSSCLPTRTSQDLHLILTTNLSWVSLTTYANIPSGHHVSVHQIAKYSTDPRMPHGEAIIYLVRYLMRSRDVRIRFSPNPSKGFECYCNANFAGNCNKAGVAHDPSTDKLQSGWIIFYADCPIIWASKLQLQIALLTTEA